MFCKGYMREIFFSSWYLLFWFGGKYRNIIDIHKTFHFFLKNKIERKGTAAKYATVPFEENSMSWI